MKTYYLEKMDKPKFSLQKIKIEQDNVKIYADLNKDKNVMKVIKKLIKNDIESVVLSKAIIEDNNFINALNANNIKIFNGRWLEKYLTFEIIDYIIAYKDIKKEETEIAITANEITDSYLYLSSSILIASFMLIAIASLLSLKIDMNSL